MPEKIPQNIEKEIKGLVESLNYHCYRYYVLDSPVISDAEYDRMYRHLDTLEKKYRYILLDSPTQRVGAPPLDKFEKVRHTEPMLSLDNAITYEEMIEFDKRVKRFLEPEVKVQRPETSLEGIEYTVEPKYDGLAIELTYQRGYLIRASTRGDGYEGEDVTRNIKTIKSVPLKIEGMDVIPEAIDIRGEVYMDIKDFEALNSEREASSENPFANPRNAAAGSVRQLNPSITASRRLHLACYGTGSFKGIEFKSQWEFVQWLKEARFPVPDLLRLVKGIDKVNETVKEIGEIRMTFPFETDGAVIKVNDFSLQRILGVKTREPRWAIAYKFPSHQGTTKIRKVILSVGRTGVITPVAILEPVRVGGVTVSRSTLHNWDEVKRKDVRVGDTVVVERAGDVIPHVVMVLKEERTGEEKAFPIPEHCPICSSKVIRGEGEVAVRCGGLNCPAQVQERIKHFASRGAMDIEGLGEKNVELLYSQGLIEHFVDIYMLKKGDLINLPRFAEKSVQNLIEAIERSKETTLTHFLYALGIPHVGEYAARLLSKNFKKLEDLYQITPEAISKIKQMGEKIALSVSDFFSDPKNIETLQTLNALGLKVSNPDYEVLEKGLPLKGFTFVITGSLPRPRKEVSDDIESLGGHVASSLSASTDYLITGESPGSKLQKARSLSVRELTYEELLKMIESYNKG